VICGLILAEKGVTKYRTAPPRASRAPRRNICLGFNWISRKCGGNVEETLNTSNGTNFRRGETSSYPPFASASSAVRAVYAVRAVRCFVTPLRRMIICGEIKWSAVIYLYITVICGHLNLKLCWSVVICCDLQWSAVFSHAVATVPSRRHWRPERYSTVLTVR